MFTRVHPWLSLILCLLPLAVLWLTLVYQLGVQWSVYAQYNYGWAVPFLCIYLFWQKWPQRPLRAEPSRIVAALAIGCFFALLYLPTRFLHEANPIWRLTSLFWACEVIVVTLCALYLFGGRGWVRHFAFPILFFLVAVPWPSGLENAVVQSLMRWNVSVTVELLGLAGIPAIAHGSVIEVSTGVVGVDEACSGIRSLQATLMISLFFGELYGLKTGRRFALIIIGGVLSFLFNVVRTSLLTVVAAKNGPDAIAGWHDPAGVTILVGCFVTLWLASLWLRKQKAESGRRIVESGSEDFRCQPSTFSFQFSALALLVWFVLVGIGTQWWYGSHEQPAKGGFSWGLDVPDEDGRYNRVNFSDGVLSQFNADEYVQLNWTDDSGHLWQMFYFRWQPSRELTRRVQVQLAKTHGPEKCLPAVGMILRSDLGVIELSLGSLRLQLHHYVFDAGGQPLNVFYGVYEDSLVPGSLANRRTSSAARVQAALAGSRNYGQQFLELAVAGISDPAEARTHLADQLQHLIHID